jgi:hypothetical protein
MLYPEHRLNEGGTFMHILKSALVCSLLVVLAGSTAAYGTNQEAAIDTGKALFNDRALGTSGKTCNDCHKDGQGLEKAGARKDLEQMVNRCIAGPLKGKALKEDSVEMRSLVLYIKSLGEK